MQETRCVSLAREESKKQTTSSFSNSLFLLPSLLSIFFRAGLIFDPTGSNETLNYYYNYVFNNFAPGPLLLRGRCRLRDTSARPCAGAKPGAWVIPLNRRPRSGGLEMLLALVCTKMIYARPDVLWDNFEFDPRSTPGYRLQLHTSRNALSLS